MQRTLLTLEGMKKNKLHEGMKGGEGVNLKNFSKDMSSYQVYSFPQILSALPPASLSLTPRSLEGGQITPPPPRFFWF